MHDTGCCLVVWPLRKYGTFDDTSGMVQEFIWDENLVPGEYYQGENPLALPKLNLQFLTLHDYLLRNFKLFQLESTYEIR